MTQYPERLLKADINISNSGDNVIITPGSGDMPATFENGAVYIVIDHINLQANGTTTLQFKSGKSSGEGSQTNYGGQYNCIAGTAIVLENSMQNVQDGVIRLAPNQSFVINLGSIVQVSGFVRYRLRMVN